MSWVKILNEIEVVKLLLCSVFSAKSQTSASLSFGQHDHRFHTYYRKRSTSSSFLREVFCRRYYGQFQRILRLLIELRNVQ